MRRWLLSSVALAAFAAVTPAGAQDGPMVLTPPAFDETSPAATSTAAPVIIADPNPIALVPDAPVRTSVMAPPMPHFRPATAGGAVAAAPSPAIAPAEATALAGGSTPPPEGDIALRSTNDAGMEPLPGLDPVPPPDATAPIVVAPEPGDVAALQAPTADSGTAGDPKLDLAYGAFQRGYYLSSFSLAIPRAESGDTAAQTLLGLIYEGGYGVPRDPEQAASWYQFASDGGNREAQFALGMMYLQGRGVPADRERAADLFEKAAANGQVAAIYNVALLYLQGSLRPADPARAADLFRQAAEAGNPDAQYVLAQLYEDGRGVATDQATATRWFAEAARLGNIPAQVEYAIRLFNGVGTAPNEAAAAQWFMRAAEVGNPIAQNRLARLLATGRGLPADPLAAAKWHVLAQRSGKGDAYLDDFFAKLTDEQRQTAVASAQRWPAD